MSRSNINRIFNSNLNALIKKLGTNAGTFISVLTLIGMGFTAGSHYNDYKKNIEILDIKKQAFIEIKELKDKNQFLSIEVKEIQTKHDLLIMEVTQLRSNGKKR